MGAAWRDLAGRKRGFERILQMVREVRGMGMEVCTTLGMLSPEQAKQLKEAYVLIPFSLSDSTNFEPRSGLTAYNHNLDTSREFYPQVCCVSLYCGVIICICLRLSRLDHTTNVWKRLAQFEMPV